MNNHELIIRPKSKQLMPTNAEVVFEGRIFKVYNWDQIQFDGSTTKFERVVLKDGVGILPVTINGNILLIEEEQPGKPKKLTIPTGSLELNEEPLQGAERELCEETGYTALDMELISSEQPFELAEWAVYLYLAKGCRKTCPQKLDGGERIETREVSVSEFFELIREGKLELDIFVKYFWRVVAIDEEREKFKEKLAS